MRRLPHREARLRLLLRGVKGRDQVPRLVERWLAGEIDVDPLVSRRIALDDVNRAFELMEAQDGIRSAIAFDGVEGELDPRGSTVMTPLSPGEPLAIDERDIDGARLIEVHGELDLATAPRLCARLDAARAGSVRAVVVDLTGVEFCDSTGLRALMGANVEVRAHGGRLVVACAEGGPVARLFDVTGARETLQVFPSAGDALASLGPPPSG